MPCDLKNRDQRIDDFLLGKFSPAEAEVFEIHAFGCAECLEELRLREQMIVLIKEERVTAAADRAPRRSANLLQAIREVFRLQPNVWIYAVAAILVVGLALTLFWRRSATPEIDAANFAELPHLESRVGQTLRSDEFSLSIRAPKIGGNYSGDIEFRWEAKKDGEDFRGAFALKILNNHEESVYAITVENGQYILTAKLAPGLYYWTLDEHGETLCLGKFFVEKPE
jgi:hypothetical protein